ncbi:anti-sigma F factor antagonist [Salsuginibacillus kocurii]|uniref:anti-sigma F factor antagonist n=1 Tax=Salsuginibacillus kocurii TaxID=427078 RepID=UPI00036520DC|nr:anti-sigma F factor antagonist [Salsuginibacillus kocurii]
MELLSELTKEKNVLCVRLTGELDHHTALELRTELDEALKDEDVHHMLLNLEDLRFMDSSGIGVILGRYKTIAAREGEVVVCAISEEVNRIFEMAGMYKVLRLEEGEKSALRTLGVA